MVAGVQTQFVHLERELAHAGVKVSASQVQPWVRGGRLERLPLPSRTRGTIRSLLTLRRSLADPADAVWSQVALPLLPLMLTKPWLRQAQLFYAIDCTPKLLFDMRDQYAIAADPGSPKGRLTTAAFRMFFRRCAGLLPWSRWAARSMIEDYGADPARVRVVPPGIDTERWKPADMPVQGRARPRLLFVGADFARKGGPLLLDLYRRHLRDVCDLHLVTWGDHISEPGVTVHGSFRPGDTGLLRLFQSADILVVPTLADCFSMAAIEAMSCGLPVITSPVGGIPEIVADGETGYLVPAGDGRWLLESINALLADPELRRGLGQTGREVALRRFSASTQARLVMDVILSAIGSEAGFPVIAGE